MIAPAAATEPPTPATESTQSEIVTTAADAMPEMQAEWRQVIVERHIVIRIPARSRASSFSPASPDAPQNRPGPTIVWREAKAPRCLSVHSLLGVSVTRDDSIDLITAERQRLRARLGEGCRTRDFYSGFYVEPNEDGMLCADRDTIQARSGTRCEIDEFRLMVPVVVRE